MDRDLLMFKAVIHYPFVFPGQTPPNPANRA